MLNLKQKAEDNAKLNENLKALPEGAQIEKLASLISETKEHLTALEERKRIWLEEWDKEVKSHSQTLDSTLGSIKALLYSVEDQSGFSKMPTTYGTYCLANVAENYEVKDIAAVPEEFIITKEIKSVDKKQLNSAIKEGVINVAESSNWLSVRPAYRTLKVM